MNNNRNGIRLRINEDDIKYSKKDFKEVKIVLNNHYFINITQEGDDTFLEMGATHHGVKLKATKVDDELYEAIELLRKEKFKDNKTD